MDALIFDFDGVVVDSEPLHLMGFRQVLATVGVELTRQDYYDKYLGFDDHDCFAAALEAAGRTPSQEQIAQMTAIKTQIVQKAFAESIQAMPGAVDLIRAASAAGLPLAVCSGALRKEIELASRCIGVLECFRRIVSAEDVAHGKPDPEGYRLALDQLAEATGKTPRPALSLAVEDSPAGIEAAHKAGLKVLAVTNSYPAPALKAADRIVESLAGLTVADLERLAQ